MAAPSGKVPIVASVRGAVDFVTANWRQLWTPALGGIGALFLALSLGGSAGLSVGALFSTFLLAWIVLVSAYTAFLRVALSGRAGPFGAWAQDAWRTLAASAVVGIFLFFFLLVMSMAAGVVLSAQMAPYQAELEQARGDFVRFNEITERVMASNRAPFLLVSVLMGVIWLALTSRLYLVAPATVDAGRVLTFNTWPWTKGALLRISGARLLLLAPCFLALELVRAAVANSVAGGAPGLVLALLFLMLLILVASLALEAGLSVFLYRGLKPPAP